VVKPACVVLTVSSLAFPSFNQPAIDEAARYFTL